MGKNGLDFHIVIQHSDLTDFADALVRQKAVIETHLGLEVRSDVKTKPIQQLNGILKLIGLRLEPLRPQKSNGRKVYQYRLDAESLARLRAVIEARKAVSPNEFASGQYGQPKSEDNDDFNGEEAGDN